MAALGLASATLPVSTPRKPISFLFWLWRQERPLWLPISDPALLPPAAGPASSAPSPLLASLSLPARPLQPPLDFKHLLTFHFNGAAPLSLFPNFSTVRAGLAGGGMQPSWGWAGKVGSEGRHSEAGSNQELILLQHPQVSRPSQNRDPWAQLSGLGKEDGVIPCPQNNCWACGVCTVGFT